MGGILSEECSSSSSLLGSSSSGSETDSACLKGSLALSTRRRSAKRNRLTYAVRLTQAQQQMTETEAPLTLRPPTTKSCVKFNSDRTVKKKK